MLKVKNCMRIYISKSIKLKRASYSIELKKKQHTSRTYKIFSKAQSIDPILGRYFWKNKKALKKPKFV